MCCERPTKMVWAVVRFCITSIHCDITTKRLKNFRLDQRFIRNSRQYKGATSLTKFAGTIEC